jgi:hypothetical protein
MLRYTHVDRGIRSRAPDAQERLSGGQGHVLLGENIRALAEGRPLRNVVDEARGY